jgi:hypothetical protein
VDDLDRLGWWQPWGAAAAIDGAVQWLFRLSDQSAKPGRFRTLFDALVGAWWVQIVQARSRSREWRSKYLIILRLLALPDGSELLTFPQDEGETPRAAQAGHEALRRSSKIITSAAKF